MSRYGSDVFLLFLYYSTVVVLSKSFAWYCDKIAGLMWYSSQSPKACGCRLVV